MNPERPARPPISGSTPLPNALLDALLPTLSDTQLRVLLVVARSTLGWKEGTGRKRRDWLSHSQLQRRTGRSGAPVSRAVDVLVKRGLLVVQDEQGRDKASARERRALRSSLFFRLGNGLLDSTTSPGALPSPSATPYRDNRDENQSDEDIETALSPLSTSESEVESRGNDTSTLETRLHFLKTTKEIQTKYNREPLSSLLSTIQREQSKDDGNRQEENGGKNGWEAEASRFLALFETAYRAARLDDGDYAAPPDEADLALLRNYFERGYGNTLEQWLPAFFACSYGFVRRRHYSLHAYLHCFFILQVHAGAIGIKSM